MKILSDFKMVFIEECFVVHTKQWEGFPIIPHYLGGAEDGKESRRIH
jgi:hypothetical protein